MADDLWYNDCPFDTTQREGTIIERETKIEKCPPIKKYWKTFSIKMSHFSFDQYEFASVYSEEYGWNYITHQYLELFKKTYENN